jgi:phosphatidylserine decarboxylase
MPDQRDQPSTQPGTENAGPTMRELYPHPLIAREGWPFIAVTVLAAAALWWLAGFWWSVPLWIAAVFMVQFFRDPPRAAPLGANLVISPADGRIVSVERAQDPYLRRDAIKLSVFMNVFNVHSNRSPVDGSVHELWYSHGSFFNAALDKASAGNERNALWIRADYGVDVTCVQIAGYIARRILCYVRKGDRLRRGQRFGFIRFGSRVDVFIPADARSRVSVGDKVYGGETILAELSALAQRNA